MSDLTSFESELYALTDDDFEDPQKLFRGIGPAPNQPRFARFGFKAGAMFDDAVHSVPTGWIRSADVPEFLHEYKRCFGEIMRPILLNAWYGKDDPDLKEALLDSGQPYRYTTPMTLERFDIFNGADALRLEALGYERMMYWIPRNSDTGEGEATLNSFLVPRPELLEILAALPDDFRALSDLAEVKQRIGRIGYSSTPLVRDAIGWEQIQGGKLSDVDRKKQLLNINQQVHWLKSNIPNIISAVGQILFNQKNIIDKYKNEVHTHVAMSERNTDDLLKNTFESIANLPKGEIERLLITIKKRVEKWDGLPTSPPQLYRDRPANEDVIGFLRRAYVKPGYLNGNLTTAHLDVLDPSLAEAVRGWTFHHGDLPDDIKLPGKARRPRQEPRKQRRKARDATP